MQYHIFEHTFRQVVVQRNTGLSGDLQAGPGRVTPWHPRYPNLERSAELAQGLTAAPLTAGADEENRTCQRRAESQAENQRR